MTQDEILHRLIPYRLNAVATFTLALRLRSEWEEAPSLQMFVDGRLTIEGTLNAFTNPALEIGAIHCRALLEFLGLCRTKSDALGNRKGVRKASDDIGIELFSNANGPLPLVTPSEACSRYAGGAAEAESALLAIFKTASKSVAHLTVVDHSSPEQSRLLEIASRGIPALVVSHLYMPLGLASPNYQNTARYREAC